MQEHSTAQERFWAGEFGDEYVDRNGGEDLLAAKTALLADVLSSAGQIDSAIELGCNAGLNLVALRRLLARAELAGVEINARAAEQAEAQGFEVERRSILGYRAGRRFDLVLCAGVLIHIAPDRLGEAYDALHSACGRYLCVAEYYSRDPAEVTYRGHADRLFKRDWGGEILDRFADLELRDYGFVYHRSSQFPLDDVTWFLFERLVDGSRAGGTAEDPARKA